MTSSRSIRSRPAPPDAVKASARRRCTSARSARDRGANAADAARCRGAGAVSWLDADLAVVAAYGLILPKPILEAPKAGCINVHASLLPRWRGAAPIQRAILAGDEVSGVTIMRMDEGLDTGPMLLKRELDIRGKNAGQVTEEMANLGAAALVEWLEHPGRPNPQPDDGVDLCLQDRQGRGADRLEPAGGARSSGRCAPSRRRRARGSRSTANASSCSSAVEASVSREAGALSRKTAGFPLSRE